MPGFENLFGYRENRIRDAMAKRDGRIAYIHDMCGIAGIVTASPQGEDALRQRLAAMSDAIRHRGPDGEGLHIETREALELGLAHRRLAITDASPAAAQPMHCLDRYSIVHNGEVYNHVELREELLRLGYAFRTGSDTEVLACAWDAWGRDCLDRIDGMFAFALWDRIEATLWCARDRFGEKPLYLHYDEPTARLHFASEMKALWAAGITRHPKEPLFLHFLTLGLTTHPQFPELTFWENILQLPPAHLLCFRPTERAISLERYWDLDKETLIDIGEEEAERRTRELVEGSLSRCLRTDAACGIALSGGLDSGILAVLGRRLLPQSMPWPSFSAVFPGFAKDESEAIRRAAADAGTSSHLATPDATGLLDDIHTLARHQEEPFTTAGIFAQFRVHRLAREQGVKVVIDGQGADEVFAGYARYSHWHLQHRIARFEFREAEAEARLLRANGFLPEWGWAHRVAAFLPGLAAARLEARADRRHEVDTDIAQTFRDRASGPGFTHKPVVRKPNDILYHDACCGPLQELLRYADRNAMSQGLELRLPYLDHRLVQFAFSLPERFKNRNGYPKWILREAYREQITEECAWRKGKTGFEPPQHDWMCDPMLVAEVRNGQEKLVEVGMLSPAVLQREVRPNAAYDPASRDWRHWIASLFL